jgi:hypothetical protein
VSQPATDESERRPLVAAVLAVPLPGLGHAYARAWIRALLWVALFATSLWFLAPDGLFTGSVSMDTLGDIYGANADLVLFVLAVWAMNVVDAYLTTSRLNRRAQQEQTCPHCGKKVDGDLEFCHWCTTPLDGPESGER